MNTKPTGYPTEPKHLWDRFFEITQIPRPSRKEEKIQDYIISIANTNNLNYKQDAEGNIVIYVPATKGYETHGAVIIQGHLDMVTVKTKDKDHNFETDPLQLKIEDGWLMADRTTLGSDNGIGVAAALATITDETIEHPPLELLFTVDEETGLNGATHLDASMLSGKKMLNLDTEDWGELYIGCAGGLGYELTRSFNTVPAENGLKPYLLSISGLAGGHSGVQIHEQLGNSLKLLAELLNDFSELGYQLAEISGGVAHNVIPRESSALLYLDDTQIHSFQQKLATAKDRWLKILPKADHAFQLNLEASDKFSEVLEDKETLVSLMTLFPHGAATYNLNQPADLVDLSSNFSLCQMSEGHLQILMSMRFFDRNEAISMDQKIHTLGRVFQLEMTNILDYPSWRPDFDNPMLEFSIKTYESLHGSKPEIKAIHAGLECGIIKDKLGDVDIISFGPTIKGAHSPTERLKISTVEPFYNLFKELLKQM